MMENNLVLSLFHGADLLGRGFEEEGFCVVRAGEIELGFDIRNFQPSRHKFDGIIAGTPCQDFSLARRAKPTGYGAEMLKEFIRVVTVAEPQWFLLENVRNVPGIEIEGYQIQRFDLNASECGLKQNRPRVFQFGTKNGVQLWIERANVASQIESCCMASEGNKPTRRNFADFCELQGLPRNFYLKMLSKVKNYQVVGNGVPPPMARVIAAAIRRRVTEIFGAESQINSPGTSRRSVTLCACGCGRAVTGKQKAANAACRKRIERKGETSLPGQVTL